jgi:hypothetical protein
LVAVSRPGGPKSASDFSGESCRLSSCKRSEAQRS